MDQKQLLGYSYAETEKFKSGLKKVRMSPSRGRVHQLRISTRRLRAIYWIEHAVGLHFHYKRSTRHLRGLGRSLGELRELDVAIKNAKEYNLETSALQKERSALKKKLRRFLAKKKRKQLLKELSGATNSLPRVHALQLEPIASDLKRKLSRLNKNKLKDARDLHELRIEMKKIRYVFEALGWNVKPLVHLQDLLGDVHDLEVLRSKVKSTKEIERDQQRLEQKAIALAPKALDFAFRALEQS